MLRPNLRVVKPTGGSGTVLERLMMDVDLMMETLQVDAAFTFSDESAASAFHRSFPTSLDEPLQKSNLDGSAATWIVLANLAITALPHVLTYLRDNGASGKVRRIVVPGMLEIDNPTREQIELALEMARKKAQ